VSTSGHKRSRAAAAAAAAAPGAAAGAAAAGTRTGPNPFRVHARRPVHLRALVTHVGTGWQRQAPLENIGLGGACIALDEKLAEGDVVTLSFTAPSLWDPLVLRARVAWVSEPGPPQHAGVAFDHKSAEAVFALYELIAALAYEE
jgi:hypothetical protein